MTEIFVQTEEDNGQITVIDTISTIYDAALICNADTIKVKGGLYEVLGYDVDLSGDRTIVHLEVVEVI